MHYKPHKRKLMPQRHLTNQPQNTSRTSESQKILPQKKRITEDLVAMERERERERRITEDLKNAHFYWV
jgi:hypothetical protein